MPKSLTTRHLLLGAASLSLLLASCNNTTAAVPASSPVAQSTTRMPAQPTQTTTLTAQFSPDKTFGPQIVYGQVSARGARPYQVLLSINTSAGSFRCGGSLIANNWVLTASHCLEGASASGVTVRAGMNDINDITQGQKIVASALYRHPNYTAATSGSDIALIKLSSNVTNSYAGVIKLPNDAVESVLDVAGKRAVVSGWGLTETGAVSSVLREVSIPITPNPTRCGNGTPPGNTICGEADSGKDSCSGDSGGPLAQSYNSSFYVLGVVSYGPSACRGNGVYTRVNAYLPWIKSVSGVVPDGATTPTTPTTPTMPTAPAGTTTYSGTLASGTTGYAPGNAGFYYAGGNLKASLTGAAGTDFDLYLQKLSGTTWNNVAYSETNQTSTETIVYNNAAAGTYRWAIYAYSGTGSSQLVETK